MLEIFPWNQNLETGIDIIDEQHKRLVHLLNQVADHLANCSHKVTLTAIFTELADYADYHFKSEEAVWSRYFTADDAFDGHKTSHDSFLADVLTLQKKYNDSNLDDGIGEIVSFLAKWLAFHILDSDKKMALTCQAIDTGMSVTEARIHAEKEMSGSAKVLIDTVLNMYDSLFNRTLDMMREKALRRQAEDALKASDEHLRFLTNGGQEGVWELHINAGEKVFSQHSVQVANILTQLTSSGRGESKIHPDDLPIVLEDIQKHLEGKTDFFINKHRVLSDSGRCHWVSSRGKVVERTENAQPLRMLGTNTDITERELAVLVYNYSSQGMFVADSDNQIISVNPAYTAITGFSPEAVIGQIPSILKQTASVSELINNHLASDGYWEGEIDVTRKSGEYYTAYFTLRSVFGSGLNCDYLVGMFTDVSQIKNASRQLWRQTNYDQVTQLPNRHLFNNYLQDELAKAQHCNKTFSLLLIDLDGFKSVNDSFGHEKGDELLQLAADRILCLINKSGFVARISGDEFAVILHDMSSGNRIEMLIDQLLKQLAEPYQLDEQQAYISASIGVAVYPGDAESASSLLQNAVQAMYSAKKRRNCFSYFTDSMQEQAQKRQLLIAEMHVALRAEQFKLYYQPIVDVKSGQISKAEALIRWFHPNLGMVSPADFIPLAEDTGLIIPLGEYIYNQVIIQLCEWRSLFGSSFQISVNKSPVQFQQVNKGRDWIDLLKKENISGLNLLVEITEGVLMDNNAEVIQRLQQFKAYGIQVAVDDFGTGYSSLSYLNKFQVDYIKIDRSFIRDLNLSPSNQTLCEAMISMAHKLNIKVVAEGVETKEQLTILKKMNCDYVQGFLFSPPVPAKEFEKIMHKYQPSLFY